MTMMPRSADEKPRVLHKLQGSIHFEKTLPATTAVRCGEKNAGLVYVFCNTQGPNKFPPRKQRRCSYIAAHSRKIAKQSHRNCEEARLLSADEGSSESRICSNRKSSSVYDCAIAPAPPSCKEVSLHLPSFWKTLTDTNAGRNGQAQLELPGGFCRKYGNRIRTVVKLQGIHKQSPERTMACRTSFGREIRHYLGAGWQDFVSEKPLHEGQQLLFTLSADSFFVVREQYAL